MELLAHRCRTSIMDSLWFGNLLLMRRWVWNAYLVLLLNRAYAYPRALLHSGGPYPNPRPVYFNSWPYLMSIPRYLLDVEGLACNFIVFGLIMRILVYFRCLFYHRMHSFLEAQSTLTATSTWGPIDLYTRLDISCVGNFNTNKQPYCARLTMTMCLILEFSSIKKIWESLRPNIMSKTDSNYFHFMPYAKCCVFISRVSVILNSTLITLK